MKHYFTSTETRALRRKRCVLKTTIKEQTASFSHEIQHDRADFTRRPDETPTSTPPTKQANK